MAGAADFDRCGDKLRLTGCRSTATDGSGGEGIKVFAY